MLRHGTPLCAMGRLILVSNRLPVQVRRAGRRAVVTPSAGGLVAGLGPVHEMGDGLWLGTLGQNAPASLRDELAQKRLVPVSLPKEAAARAYEGFSNQVLWPLFHYVIGRVAFDRKDYDAYHEVNERFADAIVEVAAPDDAIWVHDYHLMLLPRLLRERLPQARIAFFLHIPFPSSEVFRILPRKNQILDGLLGSDLVGLHTYDYARHLVTSFRRVLGIEFDDDFVARGEDRCRIGVYPLGVDFAAIKRTAAQPGVQRRLDRLKKQVLDRKVILGVDRMDYTKGLPLRLEAFRRLLELHPEWRERAMLMQLVVPSRGTIQSYRDLKGQVERMVGEINGQFSVGGLAPIHYMYRAVSNEELMAMYRLADVGLVTPVRDGMNLVAKEYVAARPDNGGVLVLSEFAGAASEMGEALLHNPWDSEGTAEILHRALTMERDEMHKRMASLKKRAEVHNVHRWVKHFLAAFEATRHIVAPADAVADESPGWQEACVAAFAGSTRALVALDYDGTVTDIQSTPGLAEPTPPLRSLLMLLGRNPKIELLIISGRDAETLSGWFGDLPVHLVAEHGFLVRLHGEPWQEVARGVDLSWRPLVREILDDYAARAPGVIIEEKRSSLAWHYRMVEPGFGSWLARELLQHLVEAFAQQPLEVHHGKKVVEVRPYGIDKGRGLGLIDRRLGPFDFILAAGDDRTDEDLFMALPSEAWSIKVGPGQSRARFRIGSPAQLRELLDRLARGAVNSDVYRPSAHGAAPGG
jgi:trehalose 6-phosphate synthase/phosphatase